MDQEIFVAKNKYISSKRSAELYGYTHDYLSRLAKKGAIKGKKFGNSWYLEESSLKKFIKENKFEYISSKKAAESSGYTHDYLSRLARVGTIEGKKFGRAWYIEKGSLSKFIQNSNKNKKTKSEQKSGGLKKEYKTNLKAVVSKVVPAIKDSKRQKNILKDTVKTVPSYVAQVPAIFHSKLFEKTVSLALAGSLVFGVFFFQDTTYSHSLGTRAFSKFSQVAEELSSEKEFAKLQIKNLLASSVNGFKNFGYGITGGEFTVSKNLPTIKSFIDKKSEQFAGSPKQFTSEAKYFSQDVKDKKNQIEKGLIVIGENIIDRTIEGRVVMALLPHKFTKRLATGFNTYTSTNSVSKRFLTTNVFDSLSGIFGVSFYKTSRSFYCSVSDYLEINSNCISDAVESSGPALVRVKEDPITTPEIVEQIIAKVPEEIKETIAVTGPTTIVERIIERVIAPSTGVDQITFNAALEAMRNELRGEFYVRFNNIQTGRNTIIQNVYQQIAHTQIIDQLNNLDISNATITSSSFSGSTGGFSGAVTALRFVATGENATSTFAGGITVDTDKFVVDHTTNNVGIGTTSPFTKLSVVGDIFASGDIISGSITATTSAIAPFFVATNVNATSTFAGGFTIDSTKFVVDPDAGRVGIGTASPEGILHLATSNANSTFVNDTFDTDNSTFPELRLRHSLSDTIGTLVTTTDGSALGELSFYGVRSDATNFVRGARIVATQNGSAGNSGTPSNLTFSTYTSSGENTNQFVLNTSGFVGVATTSPWALLSVNPNGISGPSFVVGSSTQTDFIVTNGGNVGIGTVSPSTKLDIVGSDNSTIMQVAGDSGTILSIITDASGDGALYVRDSASAIKIVLDADSNSYFNNGNVGIASSTPWGLLSVNPNGITGPSFVVGSSTQTDFIVTNGGNVGIGTTSPASKLTIIDGDIEIYSSTGANLIIDKGATTRAGTILFRTTGSQRWDVGLTDSDLMGDGTDFFIGSTASIPNLIINRSSGNVGIGTTSPYAKLSVVGPVVAEYFHATSTTAISTLDGSLIINGDNIDIGDSNSDTLTITASIDSALIPNGNATLDLGSTSFYWDDLYIDNVVANNISGASTTISGTKSETFTINTDNTTSDGEDASLVFFRGTVTPNAILRWASGFDQFQLSQDLLIQDETPSTGSTTVTIKAGAGQGTGNLLVFQDSSGNNLSVFDESGYLGVGTSSPYAPLSVVGEAVASYFTATSTTATSTFAGGLTVNTSTFVVDPDGGRVGIGTASPSVALHLESSAVTPFILANNTNAVLGTRVLNDFRLDHSGETSVVAGSMGAIAEGTWSSTSGTRDASLIFYPVLNGNTFEALRITSVGNVGIGTTSPFAKLSVAGDIYADGTLTISSLTATTSISAPFFTATDATATSTFAGGLTVNTSTFVVDPDGGRVGIGTASPGEALSVSGGIEIEGTTGFRVGGVGSTFIGRLINDGLGVLTLESDGTRDIKFAGATGGTAMFIDTSSGNIGIGTTTPSSLLEVSKATSAGSGDILTISGLNDNEQGLVIRRDKTGGSFNIASMIGYEVTSTVLQIKNGVTKGDISTGAGMAIDSSGNVGIGTTTPASKLEVEGQVSIANASLLRWNSSTDAERASITGDTSENLIFTTGSASTERLRIDSSGNIGIASSTPWGLLSVNPNGITGPAFVVGSSTQTDLIVTNGGNVGIGTASPGALLQVTVQGSTLPSLTTGTGMILQRNSAAGNVAYMEIFSGNTGKAGLLFGDTDASNRGAITYDHNLNTLLLRTQNADRLAIDSTGNIGLGTTSPTTLLTVGSTTPTSIASANYYNSTYISGDLEIDGTLYSDGALLISGVATSTGKLSSYSFVEAPYFVATSTTATSTFAGGLTVNTNTFLVDPDGGRVGIGTVTPSSDLTVNDSDGGGTASIRIFDSAADVFVSFGDNTENWALGIDNSNSNAFSINGASDLGSDPKFTILTGGNVGIGTTSPEAPLNVAGAGAQTIFDSVSATDARLEFKRAGTRIGLLNWDSGEIRLQADSGNDVIIYSGGSESMRIDSSGNVGIGTSSPQTILHLADTTHTNVRIEMEDLDVPRGNYIGLGADVDDIYIAADEDNLGGASTIAFRIDADEKMRITSSGFVGIGTTSPESLLTVNGNSVLSGDITVYNGAVDFTRNSSGVALVVNQQGTGDILDFKDGGTTVFTIVDGGNVGIGTTTPATKLHIEKAGTGTQSIFRITNPNSGGLDRTFTIGSRDYGGGVIANFIESENEARTGGRLLRINPGGGDVSFGGNVGIGTTSPGVALDVYATSMRLDQDGTGNSAIFSINVDGTDHGIIDLQKDAASTWRIVNDADETFDIDTGSGGDVRFTIDSSGNIGIGTTTPGDYSTNASNLVIAETGGNGGITILTDTNREGRLHFADGTGSSDDRGFISYDHGVTFTDLMSFGTARGTRMVIDSSGNIGIGTTTPTQLLSLETSADALISFDDTSFLNRWVIGQSGQDFYLEPETLEGDIRFRNLANDVVMFLDNSTGNVGIGTTSPNTKLNIADGTEELLLGYDFAIGTNISANSVDGSDTKALFLSSTFSGLSNGRGAWIGLYGNDNSVSAGDLVLHASRAGIVLAEVTATGAGTIVRPLRIERGTTATPANGIGTGVEFSVETAVDNEEVGGAIDVIATDVDPTNEDFDMAFYTMLSGDTATEKLRITSDGNVGIGTTSPWGLLSVNPNGITGPAFVVGSSTQTDFIVTNAGNVGIGTASPSSIFNIVGASNPTISVVDSTNSVNNRFIATDSAGFIGLAGAHPLIFETSGTEQMRILSDGKIGIASTSPWGLLSVNPNGITGPAFVVGSSTQTDFIVTNGGNVGIGTDSPGALLHVAGGNIQLDNNNDIEFKDVGGTARQVLTVDGNDDVSIGSGFLDDIFFTVGGVNEAMRIKVTTGNIGIGTTSPTVLLTVGSSTPNSIASANYYNSTYISGDLEIDGTLYTDGTVNLGTGLTDIVLSADSSGNLVGTSTPSFASIIATSTTATSTFAGGLTVNTSTFVVDPDSGRVGIGTASPDGILEIEVSSNSTVHFDSSQSFTLAIDRGNTTNDALVDFRTGNSVKASVGLDGDNTDFFHIGDDGLGTKWMTFDTGTGYIGIGTSSPWALLSVNPNGITGPAFVVGSSTQTDFIVTNGGNVGIGTDSPATLLHIEGAGGATSGIKWGNAFDSVFGYFSDNNDNSQFLLTYSGTGGAEIELQADGDVILAQIGKVGIATTSPWGLLSVNPNGITGPSFVVGSSTQTDFIVTNGGLVGIGTSSPAALLDVSGGDIHIDFDKKIYLDGGNDMYISNTFAGFMSLIVDGGTTLSLTATGVNAIGADMSVQTTQKFHLSGPTGDTYITESSANNIDVYTGGSNRLTIDSSGNVGIGTTTPDSKFHLYTGELGADIDAFTIDSDADSNNDAFVVRTVGVPASNFTDADTKFIITGPGNVGIGTSTPGTILSIENTTGPVLTLARDDSSLTTNNIIAALSFIADDNSTFGAGEKGFIKSIVETSAGNEAGLIFGTSDNTAFATERMRIDANGNVGIGASSPNTNLTILAASGAIMDLETTDTAIIAEDGLGAIEFRGTDASLLHQVGAKIVATALATWGGTENDQPTGLEFFVQSDGAGNGLSVAALTIDSTGNIGLGDGGPTEAKLVVGSAGGGDIYATFATANSERLCWDAAGASLITDCTGSPGDYAEEYGTTDPTILAGDIVVADPTKNAEETGSGGELGSKAFVLKSQKPYDSNIIGVVSTNPNEVIGQNFSPDENPRAIALNGRVPVRVSDENGAIAIGDRITTSSLPGIGMKATSAGETIGIALESYTGTTTSSIIVALGNEYYTPETQLYIDTSGNIGIGTTTPEYNLHVVGDIAAQSFINTSTRDSKKDIEYVGDEEKSGFLDKIKSLGVARYRYNSETYTDALRLGLIAEDSPEEILSADGKGVDLYKMTSFLLVGVQELAQKVDSITAKVAGLGVTVTENFVSIKDRIFVDTITYNVGIGTSTPAYDLHVVGDVAGITFIDLSANENKDKAVAVEEKDSESIYEKIKSLAVSKYVYDSDTASTTLRLGITTDNAPDEILSDDKKGINISKLATFTLQGLQELTKRFEIIKEKVDGLGVKVTENFVSIKDIIFIDEATSKIGIGTSTPAYDLHVIGSVAATSFVNISTRDAKKDIEYVGEEEKSGFLDKIKNLGVARYRYNSESTEDNLRLGLIAEESPEEILSNDGKGVDIYKMTSFLLVGVQEIISKAEGLAIQIAVIEEKLTQLTDLLANTTTSTIAFTGDLTQSLKDLGLTFIDGVVRITTLAVQNLAIGSAEKPTGVTIYDKQGQAGCLEILDVATGEVSVTPGVCIIDQSGNGEVAIEEPLLATGGQSPTLTINGNNPANIDLNSTYADLGITIVDDKDHNLGIKASVNDVDIGDISNISIDTSTSTTHTIVYSVTDNDGNTTTATRVVIVGAPTEVSEGIAEETLIEPVDTLENTEIISEESLSATSTVSEEVVESPASTEVPVVSGDVIETATSTETTLLENSSPETQV